MRLVVDSNVLFSYFWKNSVFREICKEKKVELFAPDFALEELSKHAKGIMEKTGISLNEFKTLRKDMSSHMVFIDYRDYSKYFKEIIDSWNNISGKNREEMREDIDFLAIAEMLCCSLWSNDKLLKKQTKIVVLNTKELVSLLDIH